MQQLPAALAPLAQYRQFIVCQFLPDLTRPGKTHKYPLDINDGKRHDAHDPSIWIDADTALHTAALWGPGFGVGFVFTVNDPFFFVDADDCAVFGPDGIQIGWTAIVDELCRDLAGAAVEISHSGTGLHLIGTGTAPAERRCKDKTNKLFDLYTEGRFVALTGTAAFGDAATVHTPALHAITEKHLKKQPIDQNAAWTDGPCDGWRGPADDAELLRRAMQSASALAAFSGKATFADLWTADEAKLAATYPDDHGFNAYDASRVDGALAQHLAFWTGKDCARIERLMRQSALVRAKWDDRDDYLGERTILGAVARQVDVLADKPPEPLPGPAVASTSDTPRPRLVTGETVLDAAQQIEQFAGCVYITDTHRVLTPNGVLVRPEQFKVLYGGFSCPLDPDNGKVSRDAWEVFTQSQVIRSPRADGTCFKPAMAPGAIIVDAGRSRANTWWPVNVPRKVGDPAMFLRHLAKILPVHRDQVIVLSYMAACVQHVGTKFQWAPLIQGVEGNGKTILSLCVAEAVGRRYVHWPAASKLGSQFNGWLFGKVFYGVEDIYVPGDRGDIIETLKPMITGIDLEIEGKGLDQTVADLCGNFIFNSNHKDGLRKTRNDRRFGPFFCAQQRASHLERDGMDGEYFRKLIHWLKNEDGFAIVAELLYTYPIADEFNPATGQRAPITSSTDAAIEAGLGSVEQEVQEAIEQGQPGFCNGWVSSVMLERLLERLGATRRVPLNKRAEMLASLGYEMHPGLPDGRVGKIIAPDNNRPRLFVLSGHPSSNLRGAEVERAYTVAQDAPLFPAFN